MDRDQPKPWDQTDLTLHRCSPHFSRLWIADTPPYADALGTSLLDGENLDVCTEAMQKHILDSIEKHCNTFFDTGVPAPCSSHFFKTIQSSDTTRQAPNSEAPNIEDPEKKTPVATFNATPGSHDEGSTTHTAPALINIYQIQHILVDGFLTQRYLCLPGRNAPELAARPLQDMVGNARRMWLLNVGNEAVDQ